MIPTQPDEPDGSERVATASLDRSGRRLTKAMCVLPAWNSLSSSKSECSGSTQMGWYRGTELRGVASAPLSVISWLVLRLEVTRCVKKLAR